MGFSCRNYIFTLKVWNRISLYRYSIAFYPKEYCCEVVRIPSLCFKYDGVDVYPMHLYIYEFFKWWTT